MNHNEQTTINMPKETKRKVRVLAAELGVPMGKAALKLIELGLEEYRQHLQTSENKADGTMPPAA